MTQSDVIVIGGGMAGISAAAHLVPEARVTLLEAEARLGYHATGRSAAIFIRNYGNATLRALNTLSAEFFDAPGAFVDGPLLSPRGELLLAGEDELATLSDYIDGADGLEHLTGAEAAELVPILRPERIAAAVIERDARDIDVDRMLQGYARALKAGGGRVETGAAVTAMSRASGTWTVQTAKGSHTAPLVINAAGAWADEIAALAGVARVGLSPCRRSAALLPAPEGCDIARWPLFGSVSETWYAKPDAGKLMVSPADEDPVAPHDAWPDDMVLAEGLHRFETAVTIPVTRVETSWAGLRSFAPDRTPVVGFAPEGVGFFWLAGQGGYGIQSAPALARITAALCKGQTAPLPPDVVAACAPGRFAA